MHPKDIPLNERIIFALDVNSAQEAKELVERLEPQVGFYKIGLQLFLSAGFPMVEWIAARGHKVMLDLKFYDIPQTVKLAVSQLGQRGVTFATVHGNEPIVRAAAQAGAQGIKILAVTVLTSFNNDDMTNFFGFGGKVEDLVLERARLAIASGAGGVVASGAEALRLRKELGEDFLIVTPGIRPAGGEAGDQKRVVTPGRAIADGADHVVVGRPVRDAPSPLAVIQSMLEDIEEALSRFS
jgi:orotidine-5'-phosphate decarboxylase